MGQANIILFTEIAEHLEHSTLLKSLRSIREKLKDNGILIISTPNFARLENRIKLLFGNGDLSYWGDGYENLKKGLWGHITYYDIKRLNRILQDTGLLGTNCYTFNRRVEFNLIKKILHKIIDFISLFVKNSKQIIFITAKKSDVKKIPFRI